jgi:ech hydrogenase subunit D
MSREQIELITIDTLLDKVRAKREQGHRLVQMSATRLPNQVELTYSFDLDSRLTNLRLSLPGVDTCVPSISSIYGCAILYENEIHDLFNVKVDGLTVDFHGNFYKTAIKFPFGSTKVACASSATTPASGTAACGSAPAANPGATK